MRSITRLVVLLTAVCAFGFSGCAKKEQSVEADNLAAAESSAEAESPAVGAESTDGADQASPKRVVPVGRKLIQTAELRVEVASYAEARRAVDEQLVEVKGYLANAQVEHRDGRVSRATLVLRIPTDELSAFLRSGAGLGKVLHESIQTQDITDQYTDLDARLGSAKKLEARFIELLESKTDGVKDLLEVERELGRIRERIESMEGKLRLFDKQVAYSTLSIEIITSEPQAAGQPQGLWDRAASVLSGSWSALISFGKGLVLMFAGLLPWLPLLLGAAWIMRRVWRRLARQLRTRPTMMAQPAGPHMPAGPAGPLAR